MEGMELNPGLLVRHHSPFFSHSTMLPLVPRADGMAAQECKMTVSEAVSSSMLKGQQEAITVSVI